MRGMRCCGCWKTSGRARAWPRYASSKWRPLRWLRQPLAVAATHCGQTARDRKPIFQNSAPTETPEPADFCNNIGLKRTCCREDLRSQMTDFVAKVS